MKYVPKLIPDQYKIFPDYFKGSIYSNTTKNKPKGTVPLIIAILFFISALGFIVHPLLSLLYSLIGYIILPQGQHWLEQKLQFRLTAKIKAVFAGALLICSNPLVVHYQKIDARHAHKLQVKRDAEEKERISAEQKEQQRKDSVHYYLQSAVTLQKASKFQNALNILSYVGSFTPNESELAEINNTRNNILSQKTIALFKKGNYKAARYNLLVLKQRQ